jgi:cytochrome c oxidase subunit I
MTPPPAATLAPPRNSRPELVSDGFSSERPRWMQIATSADHKDIGRVLISGSLGFLFCTGILLLLMRLQLAVPENSFLRPETFNRLLSVYGASAIFCFALPFIFGLYSFLMPLQIGARTTALPRIGQLGVWLWAGGSAVLFSSFLWTPPEAGVNPLAPLTETAFVSNNGIDAWVTAVGLATLGLVLTAINLLATLRTQRAPGMALRRLPVFAWAGAISSWLMLIVGSLMLAAVTMLLVDRNFDGSFFAAGSSGAPLLWQHLSWIFYSGAYATIMIAALAAAAEIIPALARRPLFSRGAVNGSLAAIAVLCTLAWLQNMYSQPIGIGWAYFGMAMSLAAVIPFGLVFFNLIATLFGGTLRMRAPLLFALGAISLSSLGLASEMGHSLVAVGWQLQNTTDATAATHYALVGGAVFGGFAALHFWFPKITGRVMGEDLARFSFWTMFIGVNLTFLPLFGAGLEGQVVDAYKYFDGTGVNGYNLVATIGSFILVAGIVITLVNAITSLRGGNQARPDEWGGTSLEWFALSPPPVHNFDVVPDVRSPEPLRDIRDAIARRGGDGANRGPGELA